MFATIKFSNSYILMHFNLAIFFEKSLTFLKVLPKISCNKVAVSAPIRNFYG